MPGLAGGRTSNNNSNTSELGDTADELANRPNFLPPKNNEI